MPCAAAIRAATGVACWCLNVCIDLFGTDLKDRLALLHPVAVGFVPLHDGAGFHRQPEPRYDQFD
jgi:hypothetical protein